MIIKKLSGREKRIFFLCGLTVFIYVSFNGIYIPMKAKRESLEKKISSIERNLKKNIRILKKGKAFKKEYEKVLDEFSQKVSDEEVMSSILSEIEKVAEASNMRISEMKPQRVKNIDFYNEFSVSLSMDGSLNEIVQFLYILQNDSHLFNVDDLRFDKVSPRQPKLRCRLSISKLLFPKT